MLTNGDSKGAGAGGGGGGGGGGGSGLQIDLQTFGKRLKKLYSNWQDLWNGADAVAVVTPPSSEDLRYLKSTALHIWLLGYEFPETVMVFCKGCVHVMSSQKKVGLLEPVRKACREVTQNIDLSLYAKPRNEDGATQMRSILDAISNSSKHGTPVVGVLMKEAPEGVVMEKWSEVLKKSAFQLVDVANGFTEVFSVKDESEIKNIRKAGFLSGAVLKDFVIRKLEWVIDREKKMTHAELMESTEEVISEPSKIGQKFRSENVDICYPPVFQSGGVYDLRPSAQSNDDLLYYDTMAVVICALGARYLSYCSNIARTFLVNADSSQEKAYKTLLEAHQAAINALRPNVKLSAAYEAAVAVFNKKAPELVPYLTKNAGTGIGIEFRESALALSPKNERIVKPGMVFNVALGLQKLTNPAGKDPKTKEYSLLLSDTVFVREKDAEVATANCTKEFSDVAYSFKDEEEEEEEAAAEDKKRPTRTAAPIDATPAKAFLRSDTGEVTKEAKRKEKQAELAKQKNDETYRRLAAQASGQVVGAATVRSGGDIQAYKKVDDIPTGKELMIEIDERNETVLLPIYGLMVPFHISTVKSVSNQIQQDGAHAYIRINFNVPGPGFAASYGPGQKYPDAIFLREVSFRSNDVRHSNSVVQRLKTTKRQMAQRETERADRATLVTQEKLTLAKGRPITLSDLSLRPSFPGRGKKLPGALEGHANGFRYIAGNFKSGERLDIMYRNIKHAFYQPAQNNLITLIHFHLHHPIMVGNKKTKDVQLYTEVREGVESLDGGRRSMYDPDEIEEEQRERERRNKVNTDFQQFVRRIQDVWDKDFRNLDLEFDIPFRELGFPGVPFKSTGFIMPTVNCLVELIEMPFLVITLNEVEIVNLERVGLNVRNFDMVIVFKDFKKDPAHIDAIPTSSLDTIKDWLNSMNIKYYENRLNLNWKEILRTIISDPEHFIKEGGWEFLNMDASDESASSDESKGYEPTDDEEEDSDSSEQEDSEDESVVDSDEEESEEDSDEEEEEEGLSWDELEAQAKKADRERDPSDDSDDERQRRKAKARPAERGRAPPPKRVRR